MFGESGTLGQSDATAVMRLLNLFPDAGPIKAAE
jgi:hypothetical protein